MDTPARRRNWLRAASRTVGLEELVAPLDALDELTRWVLGLPWTIELPTSPSAPTIRSFAIDCAPLDYQTMVVFSSGLPLPRPEPSTEASKRSSYSPSNSHSHHPVPPAGAHKEGERKVPPSTTRVSGHVC
jgi:hypothetical protein